MNIKTTEFNNPTNQVGKGGIVLVAITIAVVAACFIQIARLI